MPQKLLHTKGLVHKVKEDEEGVLEAAIATAEVLDRMGEVVKIDGLSLKNFKDNPILLWAHNAGFTESRPPIGKVTKLWVEGVKKKKLMFAIKFDMNDDFAAMIWNKFKGGFLNAFSIGFQPLERIDNTYTKSELLEISAVPVPANPEALAVLRSAGMETMEFKDIAPAPDPLDNPNPQPVQDEEDEEDAEDETSSEEGEAVAEVPVTEEQKRAVSYTETSTYPENKSWDSKAARDRVRKWATKEGVLNWNEYRKAFGWFNDEEPEELESYKLLHHDVDGDELKVVWRGVASAMAVLLGARGSEEFVEEERKSVYNHLKKHYDQFSKDAPEFREYQDLKETLDAISVNKKELETEKIKNVVKQAMQEMANEHKKSDLKDNEVLPEIQEAMKLLVNISNQALQRINQKRLEESKGNGGENSK